ncbi:hypothetical protein DFH07DRAFT_414197 [Mycena maculata]|uniref:BTB domain-containing protein n=1 Tax=Mycena maculata TaxID=230809 RepID=A0AAD7JCF7_9AGAR|nr:hypothetical protein DFH07DRAFT_414197 [Mycena maculata]
MSSSESSAKRQRMENAPITRSNIWHRDGSVVLQAEATQFRVHWSVLALSSPFFRDVQDLPQPSDQPSVEGCPLVELQDDATDVEYLLKALYDPMFMGQKALPFPAVAALIRLGRKYDFRHLLNSAVERLTFENPTTLEEYATLPREAEKQTTTRIVYHRGLIFDMISLARENNILSALPCAYYRAVANCDQQLFFDGIRKRDGTTASLAPVDVRRLVVARQKLVQAQWNMENTLGWLKTLSHYSDCDAPPSCDAFRNKTLSHCLASGSLRAFWNPTNMAMAKWRGLCDKCKYRAQESMTAGRKKMWEELPGFFNLPPWSELKNDL